TTSRRWRPWRRRSGASPERVRPARGGGTIIGRVTAPLADAFGRVHRSLRISVTDRCNLRCRYCMPAEGMRWLPREELLSYERLTRRRDLDRVLASLSACERHPGLRPIKVNAVALRGISEPEILPLAELARRTSYVVRFIEVMPLDAPRAWRRDLVLSGAEMREMIAARWP